MEQSRKHLKTWSIVVLIFTGLSLLDLVTELLFGDLNSVTIPEGSPENILLITKIILLAVSLLFLLPQLYIGIKGLKMAKNPDTSRGHIVWGTILLVISVIGLIAPVIAIIKQENIFENISQFASILIEALVFYDYVKYAKAVRLGK